jgi:wyosine [tRNA(Phe)-imidazoG37] synthetase (radical SAM superfamily)
MHQELGRLVRLAKSGGLARDAKFRDVGDLTREIKDIAFSGDGEPTLVRNFTDCVKAVVAVKQAEALAGTKIVLITDAAGLDKADVKRGLSLMDAHQGEVWGKLDAGTEGYFRMINRSKVRFQRILDNLLETARARPIVIQSMFLKWNGARLSDVELQAYCGRLEHILESGGRIKEVHAYTVARPAPEAAVTRLVRAELEEIAEVIRRRTDLKVLAFD